MSDAYKCDRCGRMFEARGFINYITVVPTSRNGYTLLEKASGDMCDECSESFEEWWNEFREEGE